MSLSSEMSRWLVRQLELMPDDLLHHGSRLLVDNPLLELFLGEREAAEFRALLERPEDGDRSVSTVLIPGIMGSLLASVRGICALLWLNPTVITGGELDMLSLDAKGTEDLNPDVEIVPVGIEKTVYLKLILALARKTRLYEFPYDWRRHVEWNADLLGHAIHRWAAGTDRRFVLVTHSMGGLVARTYLALHTREAEKHIERVVLMGSPLYGAPLSVLAFSGQALHTRIVAALSPENDLPALLAGFPSCYQLLPPPPAHFAPARRYPVNWDLYDARAWDLPGIRQDYLDDARGLHHNLAMSDPQVEVVQIAGCHRATVTDIWRNDERRGAEGQPAYTLLEQEDGDDSGDDTVPLWSTRHPHMRTYYVEAGHHALPSNRHVVDAVLALARGEGPDLPEDLPRPAQFPDLMQTIPVLGQIADLRRRIEEGELGWGDLQKLFFAR